MAENTDILEYSLSFKYEGESSPALRDVRGSVRAGQCIVLCGGSGCGKSTLLRCINQLIPQFYEGELKGFCSIGGRSTGELSIGETGRLAASVFQDPRSQFFTLKSDTEIAFGLENFGFSRQEMERRVDEAFSLFSLQRLRGRRVFELSGGERQLTAIMAAWALDTDIFLLDEPSANLDFSAIGELRRLLELLKAQGKTLIISEHRLYYLSSVADEYRRMEEGRVCEVLSREQLLSLSPQELHSRALRLSSLKMLSSGGSRPKSPAAHSFEARDICYGYRGAGQLIRGMSMKVCSGEVLCLCGHNGCGKTTFGKLCAGLLKPSSGEFLLDGRALSRSELSRQCIFIMQESEFQFFTNSVMNELLYGSGASREKIKELLKRAGMWELRNRHPFSLSGGQMQKLSLLLACVSPKPVAILDEPTAGLDYKSLCCCASLIREMAEEKAVIIISHDLELAGMVCTGALSLIDGRPGSSFRLSQSSELLRLREFMELCGAQDSPPPAQKKRRSADPRVKLLIFLLSMLAGIGTREGPILCVCASVLLCLLAERSFKLFFSALGLMGGMYLLYYLIPSVATAFIISFFPRVLLISMGALLIVRQEEAPAVLAALRKLRVPERLIMVCSVIFRFFPVLTRDVTLMNQAIRSRGFFPTLSSKLRSLPGYLEIVTVPMVFRVIRIAEALSASAETRGIALPGRRESYTELKFTPRDVCILCLTVLLTLCGIII